MSSALVSQPSNAAFGLRSRVTAHILDRRVELVLDDPDRGGADLHDALS
jgi:hypothetical protein